MGSRSQGLGVKEDTSCYLVLIEKGAEQPNQATILQKLSASRTDIATKFAMILGKFSQENIKK